MSLMLELSLESSTIPPSLKPALLLSRPSTMCLILFPNLPAYQLSSSQSRGHSLRVLGLALSGGK